MIQQHQRPNIGEIWVSHLKMQELKLKTRQNYKVSEKTTTEEILDYENILQCGIIDLFDRS